MMETVAHKKAEVEAEDAIIVSGISKYYRVPLDKKYTVYDNIAGIFKRDSHNYKEFWALKDVNFTIKKGETFGVIGSNGSGKSTLLKVIAGVLYPDSGTVKVNGRIAPFLELGVGFQPELSAENNVYLYGSIMGMNRDQIRKKIDNIFQFAELEKFRNIRLKNFSSGMYARLAFSTAISTDPDIILIDEALSVGDEAFQEKCYDKINEFRRNGKTIVFVSHGMDTVKQLCKRSILLDHGIAQSAGDSEKVISDYRYGVHEKEERELKEQNEKVAEFPKLPGSTAEASIITDRASQSMAGFAKDISKDRWGTREIEILEVRFLDKNGIERYIFTTGETMAIHIKYFARTKINKPVFGVAIYNNEGVHVTGPNTKFNDNIISSVDGEGFVEYIIDSLPLLKGTYLTTAAVYDYSCTMPYDHIEKKYMFKVIESDIKNYGLIDIKGSWKYGR